MLQKKLMYILFLAFGFLNLPPVYATPEIHILKTGRALDKSTSDLYHLYLKLSISNLSHKSIAEFNKSYGHKYKFEVNKNKLLLIFPCIDGYNACDGEGIAKWYYVNSKKDTLVIFCQLAIQEYQIYMIKIINNEYVLIVNNLSQRICEIIKKSSHMDIFDPGSFYLYDFKKNLITVGPRDWSNSNARFVFRVKESGELEPLTNHRTESRAK